MKLGKGAASRRAAIYALSCWLETASRASSPGPLVPDGLAEAEERPFVQDIVYTAVRMRRAADFIISTLVPRPPRGELHAILLCGLAQIFFMRAKTPDFAAVNETVAAARATGKSAAGFANAVLRNALRRRAEIEAALAAAPPAVRESFPDALVRRWTERFGPERAAAICASMNAPADVWIARPPPDGYSKLGRGLRVEDVPGFAEGRFIVQDPATAPAVELLGAGPGMEVLDWCAAPGGKSVQALWRLGGSGRLVAWEKNPARRVRLVETLSRVAPGAANWSVPDEAPQDAVFGRVLVDAPCSNTGVLRRRPDARWRWSEKKLGRLVALQQEVLDEASRRVAPGGTMVYSTCSIEPEENMEAAERFAASHPDFSIAASRETFPDDPGDRDGSFACAFVRRG